MLPTEMFSGDAVQTEPWTPAVWTKGPDKLVADAQQQLFQDQSDFESVLSGSDRAMSGSGNSPQNESDQLIGTDESSPSRSQNWKNCLNDLYKDEPLAAWSSGQKDGPANPPA